MAVIKDNKRATSAKRLAPAIARPNVIVNKPAPIKPRAQATSWSPPGVAGAGGMNRNYLGPLGIQPTGRISPYPMVNRSATPPPLPTPSPFFIQAEPQGNFVQNFAGRSRATIDQYLPMPVPDNSQGTQAAIDALALTGSIPRPYQPWWRR